MINFVKEDLRIESAELIVTDLKPDSLKISEALNMKHQFCFIHFIKAVENIRNILSWHNVLIKGKYLTENPDISDAELDKLVKKDMKEITEAYKDYKKEYI